MTQIAEAIYSDGVLKPTAPLHLTESQRVRLTIEPIVDNDAPHRRVEAMRRLREGIRAMNFRSTGPLPSRDELYDRD